MFTRVSLNLVSDKDVSLVEGVAGDAGRTQPEVRLRVE